MNRTIAAVLSLLLCLSVCAVRPLSAQAEKADPEEPEKVLTVSTVEEFLEFSENCRIDSYSRNLQVSLQADLNLVNSDFSGVPIFGGVFRGNGHTISGLSLSGPGSEQGLFRYLTDTALVSDLTVTGSVEPQGSGTNVGGIAGSNAGTISGCSFRGRVCAKDSIGGLAGINQPSGVVEDCEVSGSVYGNHFAGGIAGTNKGVIRSCTNLAQINTTEQQNRVEISDISIGSMMGSEAAHTVTDIGGIAGSSAGVIRDCENRADVGYSHMGYNIGGIAGSQTGYLTGCWNYGAVSGRKEVGGIVGQLEPVNLVSFDRDTLQILQEQMTTLAALTGQASADVSGSITGLSSQLAALKEQTESARQAVDDLLPDVQFPPEFPPELPDIPDFDEIIALQNNLSSSVSSMMGTLESMMSTAGSAAGSLSRDVQAVMKQAEAVGRTVGGATEDLGISIQDVSDADTEQDVSAKVHGCTNRGIVTGDRNTGGIVGAVAVENNLDHEDDLQIFGEHSMNVNSRLRAVVLDCRNCGKVSVRKKNAGGIAGWMLVGLTKDCVNTGNVEAESADCVGGIAGSSSGFLRSCSTKCELAGADYVGGIAGKAMVATDCSSLVLVREGGERVGTVLGTVQDSSRAPENPVSGNYYFRQEPDLGGIDGISYAGKAEPLDADAFLALKNIPEEYSKVTICFVEEGGKETRISVPFNGSLTERQIPPVPEKQGCQGRWDGLESEQLKHIVFDRTYSAVYRDHSTAVISDEQREDGRAILLAQGDFPEEKPIFMKAEHQVPIVSEDRQVLETWQFSLPADGTGTTLHYALPEDAPRDRTAVLVRGADGTWREAETTREGTYLLFALEPGDDGVCMMSCSGGPKWVPYAAVAAAVVLTAATVLMQKHRARKKAADSAQPEETNENSGKQDL